MADENLRRAIVLGVQRREPAVRFFQAFELGASARDDLTVLQISAEQQCMLVSHDVRTLPRYFREFIDRRDSPGLVLIPQRLALRTAIESLVLLWAVCEDTEWLNRICYLPI